MKPIFRNSPTLTIRLILFSALSVALMTLEHRNEKLQLVRDFLVQLVYPVQYLVSLPGKAYAEADEFLTAHTGLIEENRRLRESQIILESRLQKLNTLSAENERLQRLLSSSNEVDHRVLIAEMLSVDMDPYRQNVLIDKGSKDEVYVGQPIIDAKGVMGQITQVSSTSSTALLISDPSHSVPVRVVRNGLRSIATGIGKPDQVRLDYIPGNGDIEEGDVLVSSGLGGRFPMDYPVATVSHVNRQPGQPFATVYAEPAAELDRSHQVLLVWQLEPRDKSPLNEFPTHGKKPWPAVESLALWQSAPTNRTSWR